MHSCTVPFQGLIDLSLWGSRVPPEMPDEPVKAGIPHDPNEPFWPPAAAQQWFRPSHLEPISAHRVRGRRFTRQDLNQVAFPNQQPQRNLHHHQTRLGRGMVRAPGRLWDPLRGWVDVEGPVASRQVWVSKQPLKKKPSDDGDEDQWPVGKVAKEFCEDTSLHGVQYLGEGHWCERCCFFSVFYRIGKKYTPFLFECVF